MSPPKKKLQHKTNGTCIKQSSSVHSSLRIPGCIFQSKFYFCYQNSIFAIIGEELGFILGTVPVLTLFLLIFFRGLKVAKECTDPFGVFLAVGISFNLILYAFVNVAVVTGVFPVTGLPMPMVSYGGSGMVINMALIGILLNISQARRSVGSTRGWSPSHYG